MVSPETPDAAWLRDLNQRDGAIHAELNSQAAAVDDASLRSRNAEVAAALTQARHGVAVREAMISSLHADNARLRNELAAARAEAEAAQNQVESMLRSARWRAADLAVGAVRAPLRVARTPVRVARKVATRVRPGGEA